VGAASVLVEEVAAMKNGIKQQYKEVLLRATLRESIKSSSKQFKVAFKHYGRSKF